MTRILADMLAAEQPRFRLRIGELEQANGHPNGDIRLTTDILTKTRAKLFELGLDPDDTTAEELYASLCQRLLGDDKLLQRQLRITSEADPKEILTRVFSFQQSLHIPRQCFAIRHSVAKRLLRKVPPKKTMHQLGYRSFESMLKHEPIALLFAAVKLYESHEWHKTFHDQYAALRPSDFETRQIEVLYPHSRRWEKVTQEFTTTQRQIIYTINELGALVIMPMAVTLPALTLTTTLLLLDGINTIRCSSAYLKLQQVRPEFGKIIADVADSEPYTNTQFAGFLLPWHVLQFYYQRVRERFFPQAFQPHVQPEDITLANAEAALSEVLPSLVFWQDTNGLALLNSGHTVSLNMLDVALSVANQLAFEDRLTDSFRKVTWTRLISGYLKPDFLEQVLARLIDEVKTPELVEESVSA